MATQEGPVTVMQITGESADRNKQPSNDPSNPRSRGSTPEAVDEVVKCVVTEVAKALNAKQDTSQKAIADLKSQITSVVNAVQARGVYVPEQADSKTGK